MNVLLALAMLLGQGDGLVEYHGQHRPVAWTWTQPAPHHESVVRVESLHGSSRSKGSGAYVSFGELLCVLTAEHVIAGSKTAYVYWSDGTRSVGDTMRDKYENDVALVFVQHKSIKPLEVAESVGSGEWVECAGYGGPADRLRTFSGNVTHISNRIEATAGATEGDSGGPWFNRNNQVVGVMSTGAAPAGRVGQFHRYTRCQSPTIGSVRAFLGRIVSAHCSGGS